MLDLNRVRSVDAYEIPHTVREAVRHRQIASVFPYSGATGVGMDLDHTDPYRWDGTPGQTGPTNLGPLTRGEHNAKTHGMWTVTSPHPGVSAIRRRGPSLKLSPCEECPGSTPAESGSS